MGNIDYSKLIKKSGIDGCIDKNTTLTHTIFPDDVNLVGLDIGADLENDYLVDLSRTRLKGVNFQHACLDGVHFEHADLRDADFRGASLDMTFFTHADLRGARFDKCDLRATDIRFADLRGAITKGAKMPTARDLKIFE